MKKYIKIGEHFGIKLITNAKVSGLTRLQNKAFKKIY